MFFLILGFKFKNAQKLKFRQNSNFKAYYNFLISKEPKPLTGSEKLINYAIIGFFYFLMVIFMPLSLIFCLKVGTYIF